MWALGQMRRILAFTGASNVLATAIRYDYLWNHIVKGGAYGSLYTIVEMETLP